ncbi:hypothetical protein E2C01_071569 [Portunus trituberculatus]|uniref:Uncharacterized protein n=1 Tax=Portunus trituberculatus TaxID=210409 RepID=A0A5B7I8J9_PORTR|nr:hypothetical protein [Portunus trituberculatus]
MKVLPKDPVWRCHLEQLQPHHTSELDSGPGDWCEEFSILTEHPMELEAALGAKEKWNSSKLHRTKFPVPEEYRPQPTMIEEATGIL